MSDLVARLRAASHDERLSTGMLYRDAADEIERLREANKWLDAGRTEIVPILKERAERAEAERDAYRDAATARDRNEDALRALLTDMWRVVNELVSDEYYVEVRDRYEAALRDEKTGRG